VTAFYLSYPPERYQREEQHRQVGNIMFETTAFGRFHFGKINYPNPSDSFVYVLLHDDGNPCAQPQPAWQTALWKVGRCGNSQDIPPEEQMMNDSRSFSAAGHPAF